ncbi:hypothetical protein ACNO7T_08040 [Vibrio campbellii]
MESFRCKYTVIESHATPLGDASCNVTVSRVTLTALTVDSVGVGWSGRPPQRNATPRHVCHQYQTAPSFPSTLLRV